MADTDTANDNSSSNNVANDAVNSEDNKNSSSINNNNENAAADAVSNNNDNYKDDNANNNNSSNNNIADNSNSENADPNAQTAAFVPEVYYAIRDYEPNAEGQLNVLRGEVVYLLDDSDVEWWYAASPRTDQTGYIPALFIESQTHKDARDNTEKNKKIQLPPSDLISARRASKVEPARHVIFNKKCSMLLDSGQTKLVPLAPPAKVRMSVAEEPITTPSSNEETFAQLGLVRVYAGIWNVTVTYKVVKMDEFTTTEAAIPLVVKKFNTAPDVKEKLKDPENYCLVIQTATRERVLKSSEKPAMELANLPDTDRIGAKLMIKLKDTRPADSIPVRIYSDEQSFKTIVVDFETTIEEAMILAMQKFKLSDKNQYHLRVFTNAQEREMEDDDNIYQLVTEEQASGGSIQNKFFIKRKPTLEEQRRQSVVSEGQTDRRLLRIYGGMLDMDIAYKAILVSKSMVADDVIQLALDRYDSLDPVSMYCLVMVVAGKDVRILEDSDHPFDVQKSYEDMNPDKLDSIKMYLRRRDKQPGAVIKQYATPSAAPGGLPTDTPISNMRKTPFRVYCDWLTDKSGKKLFKPFLIGVNDTAHQLFFELLTKFDLNKMVNEDGKAFGIYFVIQDKESIKLEVNDIVAKVREKLLEERKPNITAKDIVLRLREIPLDDSFKEFLKPIKQEEEEEEEKKEEEEEDDEEDSHEVTASSEDLTNAVATESESATETPTEPVVEVADS